eukprot:Amastigsp_a842912_29.p6 type:complete len:127 gc:universal Amastigsp_a842912_29:951-571(-)
MPPPSCAKRATSEAPKPKPVSRCGILPTPICGWRIRFTTKRVVMPTTTVVTTSSPANPPPRMAICTESLYDERAAAATRTFARTDIHMPIKPETPEQSAPRRNEMDEVVATVKFESSVESFEERRL